MLLLFVRSEESKQTGGRHGDDLELALWNGVPALQYLTDRSGWVAVRERTRSLSFLVLRGLRSPDRVGRRLSNQYHFQTNQPRST
jgi:hypothetical protein